MKSGSFSMNFGCFTTSRHCAKLRVTFRQFFMNSWPKEHNRQGHKASYCIIILFMLSSGVWPTIARGPTLCLIAIFLANIVDAQLFVRFSNNKSAIKFVAYPIIYPNNFKNETITGELVLYNATDVADKVVLVPYYRAKYQSQIRAFQARNVSAVIISAGPKAVPGQASYILDGTSKYDLYLPAWHISLNDYKNLTTALVKAENNNDTGFAVLVPSGNNPWKQFNDTVMIAFQSIIGAFCVANLSLCIWRFVGHFKADRCQRRLVRVCLALIFVGNLFRLVYFGVDPIWSRQIYPLAFQHIMLTFSHTFTGSVVILITFYWHDMMRGLSLDINQLLGRFKYLFVGIIVLLFVVELTMSILRSLVLFPVNIMLTVHATLFAATCLAFAIFFFVTAGRLVRTMQARDTQEKKESKRAALERVTTIIIVIGVCLLGQLAIFIIAANPSFVFIPTQGAIWFCSYFLLCVQDLLLILVLAPKGSKASTPAGGVFLY